MAWVKPDNEDLAATLSQVEIDEFNNSPDFSSQENPSGRVIADAAEMVRGYLRKLENKGAIKIHPEDGYIPQGLMNPCMDIAAFKMLKRFNLEPTEARKRAYEEAMRVLRDVGNELMIPESYTDPAASEEEQEDAVAGIVPFTAMEFNAHILDHEPEFVP